MRANQTDLNFTSNAQRHCSRAFEFAIGCVGLPLLFSRWHLLAFFHSLPSVNVSGPTLVSVDLGCQSGSPLLGASHVCQAFRLSCRANLMVFEFPLFRSLSSKYVCPSIRHTASPAYLVFSPSVSDWNTLLKYLVTLFTSSPGSPNLSDDSHDTSGSWSSNRPTCDPAQSNCDSVEAKADYCGSLSRRPA